MVSNSAGWSAQASDADEEPWVRRIGSLRHYSNRHCRKAVGDIIAGLILAVLLTAAIFPIAWIVGLSLKTRPDIFAWPPKFMFKPTLQHFRYVLFGQRSFMPFLTNSLVVAASSTVAAMALGTSAGYALARARSRRAQKASFYVLSTRMMPPIVVILPFYLIMRTLGLVDTRLAIVLAHTTFNLPIVVWLMKGFFEDLPEELDEAAQVDGCSPSQAFFRIMLPLAAPGLSASSIFCFIFSWNEFLYSLILSGYQTKTLPVAIVGFQSSVGIRWGEMAAGCVVAIAPIIAFTLAVQGYLVRGLTAGAIKG